MWIPDAVLDHVREKTEEPDLAATKYTLGKPLGHGGMGVVYSARDRELERDVALKVCATDDVDRARREACVLAKLEHPGIVPVHDVGVLPDGRVFYAMKLVRGDRLDRWLAKPHELGPALLLFRRICEAVGFAHAHGVIHRDLKPENVMVGEFGEALVMDWGLARTRAEDDAIVGTRGFMSPEQERGEPVTVRSDIFSLGAVLRAIAGDEPPKPLRSIIEKATTNDPSGRYETAMLLADDVERFLAGHAVSAHRESLVEQIGRFATRHRVLLTLLAVYLAVRIILALLPN